MSHNAFYLERSEKRVFVCHLQQMSGYLIVLTSSTQAERKICMEAIIFIGIQATGKSTFYKNVFFKTHVRINLDMLRTRHRERLLLNACFEMKQPFVVDNTNPTKNDRKKYIDIAKEKKFKVIGYYFSSEISRSIERNDNRPENEKIPERGIKGTYARLQLPDYSEGFDELYYVKIDQNNGFDVVAWEIENEV